MLRAVIQINSAANAAPGRPSAILLPLVKFCARLCAVHSFGYSLILRRKMSASGRGSLVKMRLVGDEMEYSENRIYIFHQVANSIQISDYFLTVKQKQQGRLMHRIPLFVNPTKRIYHFLVIFLGQNHLPPHPKRKSVWYSYMNSRVLNA